MPRAGRASAAVIGAHGGAVRDTQQGTPGQGTLDQGIRNQGSANMDAPKKTPRKAAAFSYKKYVSNYFDTDFLNMRSIFSLVASQQAWLA